MAGPRLFQTRLHKMHLSRFTPYLIYAYIPKTPAIIYVYKKLTYIYNPNSLELCTICKIVCKIVYLQSAKHSKHA